MEAAPDFSVIMKNIASTFPSIHMMLAAIFMLMAAVTIFSGILDLAQSSDRQKKYVGTGHHASAWSGIAKIIIAGFMANLAVNGQMISVVSSVFFSDNSFSLISIDSYISSPEENEIQKYLRIVIIGITQMLGLIAVFKGLRIWAKVSDRTGKEGFWHGVNYLIFGTLCIQVAKVMGVIQATIGFDVFKMVGFV